MEKKSKKQLILIVLGVFLIVASIVTVISIPILQNRREKEAKETVSLLKELIPQIHRGAYDDRINIDMPAMEINGNNYSGIIELPKHSVSLPVGAEWNTDAIPHYPHRYSGSVYNGSLVIGGSGNKGQFDFMKTISIGDAVFFTDMTGASYSFTVFDIKVKNNISTDDFSENYGIVLFAKDSLKDEFTIVYCEKSS